MLQKLQLGKILLTGKKYLLYSTYIGLGFILFCAIFSQGIIRFVVWPNIPRYQQEINQFLSKSTQATVEIGEIQTFWRGFRPGFIIKNTTITNPADFPAPSKKIGLDTKNALEIPQVEGIINWSSLWDLSPNFQYLSTQGAKIYIARNPQGLWNIAGLVIKPTGNDARILSWIMKESHLAIQDLFLEVNDQFEEVSHFSVRLENMSLQNNQLDHAFNLLLSSEDLNGQLSAKGNFKHRFGAKQTNIKNWQGHFEWHINHLDIKQLLDLSSIPARGKIGELEFRGEYDLLYGGLTSGNTYLKADDVNIYWKNSKNNLLVKHLTTNIDHHIEDKQQVLSIKTFEWSNSDTKSPDTSLANILFKFEIPDVAKGFKHLEIKAPWIHLEPISQLVLSLPLPNSWLKNVKDLSPRGEIQELLARYNHRPSTLEKLTLNQSSMPYFEFKGSLQNVGWREIPNKVPGLQNINGLISGTDSSGHAEIDAPQLSIQAGNFIANKSVILDNAKVIIDWHQTPSGPLEIKASNIQLSNKMLNLQGAITYLQSQKSSRQNLDLDLNLSNTKAPYLVSLLPNSISADALNYLQKTIMDGTLEKGSVKISGDPNGIPYSKDSPSKFLIDAQLNDVTFRPIPINSEIPGEWLPLEKANPNVSMNNESLSILIPTAQFKNTFAKNFKVDMNLRQHPTRINIDGNVTGKATDFLKYLGNSPIGIRQKEIVEKIDINGDAALKLSLVETLQTNESTLLQADLSLLNNQVRFDDYPAGTINSANIAIDSKGIKSLDLTGNWLGGPTTVSTKNKIIEMAGSLDASKLMEVITLAVPTLNKSIKNNMKGSLSYQSTITRDNTGFSSNLNFDLKQVQLDFPDPIIKPSGVPMLGNFKLASGNNNSWDWQFKMDTLLQSFGSLRDNKTTKHLLAIGDTSLPTSDKGIAINMDVASLNIDKWNQILVKPKKIDSIDAAKSLSREFPPIEINAKLKSIFVANKKFENVSLQATHDKNEWKASFNSPLAIGNFEWIDSGNQYPTGFLKANFSTLTIPSDDSKESITRSVENSKEKMPDLDIQVTRFSIGKKELGELKVLASSQNNTWELKTLNINNPHGIMNATGRWQFRENEEPSRTYLDFELNSKNTGDLLNSLGYVQVLSNGTTKLEGKISWAGAPYAFSTKSLNGEVNIVTENGKILQVDTGAAKLLGILSLQGLLKFATLNFSGSLGEVVTTGTSFDKISASAVMKRGILQTNDFEMMTTPARIAMTGLVNLNQETQDIRVVVYPRINLGSAGLAVFYFTNPIIGLGTMLGQYLLSSGVNKALQSDYLIQGNWQNPEIIPLDQNGNPIDPEALKTIRRKNLLNETPGKATPVDTSLNMPVKLP